MWRSFREYIPAVVRRWWAVIVFGAGDALGITSSVLGKTILLPYWAWFIIGAIALIVAQFLAYHEVRKQRDDARNDVARLKQIPNDVESAILELESGIVSLGGQLVSMAKLFWILGQHFVRGIRPDSIFHIICTIYQKANADECNKAEQNLVFKLRSLQLIHDEQRQHRTTGYTLTIATLLGSSVINELAKKWGYSPWPSSAV